MAEKKEKKERRTRPEDQLPSRADALNAFAPALAPHMDGVRAILDHLAANPPQVLVLEGGTAEERFSMALWYAARLNCEEEDAPCLRCATCLQTGTLELQDLKKVPNPAERDDEDKKADPNTITVREAEKIRSLRGRPPHGSGFRVSILAEAQNATEEACNLLLKTLEEPSEWMRFLLLVPQRQQLLPTLVSRGWVISLPWPQTDAGPDGELRPWLADLADFLLSGRVFPGRAAAKGAVNEMLARRIVVAMRKAQTAALVGKVTEPLADRFAVLDAGEHLRLTRLLAACQESLDKGVNPALVLNWMASQVYVLCRTARERK